MKLTAYVMMFALVPAWAQIQSIKTPATVAAKPSVGAAPAGNTQTVGPKLSGLEKELDNRLSTTGSPEPCVLLGPNRGLVVPGFGAVFTSEVELMVSTGGIGLFQPSVSPDMKEATHKKRLARIPALQQTMRDMVSMIAQSPSLKLNDSDQIVVAVRMMYRPWEDLSGLPNQIVARADRRGGNLKLELQ